MNMYDIVTKLVGPIYPIGETHEDIKRLANLRVMVDLVEKLVENIQEIAIMKDRQEHSIKTAGICADNALANMFDVDTEEDIPDDVNWYRDLLKLQLDQCKGMKLTNEMIQQILIDVFPGARLSGHTLTQI